MTTEPVPNRPHIRTRLRPLPGLPQFVETDREYVPSPLFDRMELHRTYHLAGLYSGALDAPGELAYTLSRERLRPSGRIPLDSIVEFPQFSDRNYNGRIGFQARHRVGNRLWLIGVELFFSNVQRMGGEPQAEQVQSLNIGVTLHFNPTRLFAHAIKRGIDMATAGWRELLVSDELTHSALCDLSYNGNDNVLPADAFVQLAAPYQRVTQVARCLAVVEEFMDYLLLSDRTADRLRRPDEPELRPQGPWQIRSAEVYQEFRQVAPPASDAVRRMLPALRQVASELVEQLWTQRAHSWQPDEARSPVASYTLRLTNLVNLGIYAKTRDRIRMEVRYTRRVPSGGALSLEGRLMALARDAVTRVNEARRAIVMRSAHLDQPRLLGEALGAFGELSSILGGLFAGAPQRHRRALETLLTWGAVEAGPDGIITTAEARRLVRLGVLHSARIANKSKLSNRYPLSPRFAALVSLFNLALSE